MTADLRAKLARIEGLAWSDTYHAMRSEGVAEDRAMAHADIVRNGLTARIEAALATPPVPAGLEAGRQAAKAAADRLGLCGAWLSTDDDGTGWVCVQPPHDAGDHRGITVSTGDERLREALRRIAEVLDQSGGDRYAIEARSIARAALNETPQ